MDGSLGADLGKDGHDPEDGLVFAAAFLDNGLDGVGESALELAIFQASIDQRADRARDLLPVLGQEREQFGLIHKILELRNIQDFIELGVGHGIVRGR